MKLHHFLISVFLSLSFIPVFGEEMSPDTESWTATLIKISSDEAIGELEAHGVRILRRRGDILLCYVPRENNGTRGTSDPLRGVERMEKARKSYPVMDKAREWFDASAIHSGSGFPLPYTGKGVVTGICDTGIDPLHIAFLDGNGNPRIKLWTHYDEEKGERMVMETREEYAQRKTDTARTYHASHVANIMAGSYGQYHGMAPDSEIVISTSGLTDVGILCGAEDILEYANEQGKRAVINMSLANYTGPHDGTSLFCQYLDMLAEEAVVVLSSGNGGRSAISLSYNFTQEKDNLSLPLYSTDWVQFNPYGMVDVWSIDSTPLRLRFGIYDEQDRELVKWYPWKEMHDSQWWCVTSDPEATSTDDFEVEYDPEFADIYSGYFAIGGEINSENGRYNITLQYNAHTDHVSSYGPWARYVPVVGVEGSAGSHADIYSDGSYTVFRSLPGEPAANSDMSISDLATGHNTISVGMYVNRATRPNLEGEELPVAFPVGTVAPMSSYGTLADSRVMPHTVSPGYAVVSAISRYCKEFLEGDGSNLNAVDEVDGEKYYWCTNYGTSMASPYVAGSIACWLEAVPQLKGRDIRSLIELSNRHDYPDADNPRHGLGWFDPAAGLKLALERYSAIPETGLDSSDGGDLRLSFDGSYITVWNPSHNSYQVNIHDISGRTVGRHTVSAPVGSIGISDLNPGIYVVTINGSDRTLKFAR